MTNQMYEEIYNESKIEEIFEKIFTHSYRLKETTTKALLNNFYTIQNKLTNLPLGEGETLDLNQVVDIFINNGNKFQNEEYEDIEIPKFIRGCVKILNNYPNFTSYNLKQYFYYFFKILHQRNENYGITEKFLQNQIVYDRLSKSLKTKNYMKALVIQRQDDTTTGEIKEVIIREKNISYYAGLDKYLSDVIIWDAKDIDLQLEKITIEELTYLIKGFKNCIIKIGKNL
jgi:hypothetical protein